MRQGVSPGNSPSQAQRAGAMANALRFEFPVSYSLQDRSIPCPVGAEAEVRPRGSARYLLPWPGNVCNA